MILATTHFNALYLARYFLLEEAGIMGTDNALSYVSPRNIYLLYERKRDRVEYYFNLNTLIKLKQYYQPMANKFNLETTINTCSRPKGFEGKVSRNALHSFSISLRAQ